MTYLLAAYVVTLVVVLVWLAIHTLRLVRLEREVTELAARSRAPAAERRERQEAGVG